MNVCVCLSLCMSVYMCVCVYECVCVYVCMRVWVSIRIACTAAKRKCREIGAFVIIFFMPTLMIHSKYNNEHTVDTHT